MFVSPAFKAPVLGDREDRRSRKRFAYPAVVMIDGRPMPGRDISSHGLSILMPSPAVGDIVQVALAGATGDAQAITSPARVVRVDASPDGIIVGLEFIE
jgi:hypothetical protein